VSKPILRGAGDHDVDGITRLVMTAFGKYVERIGRPPAPMTADYAELVRTSRVWVIEDDGEIVGVLVTHGHPDHLLLDCIAVAPTAQGGGHGHILLERADRDARELGLSEIRLCTNQAMTENLEFYPRRGFHETGRGTQDGYHRVFFAKTLAPSHD
jgi:N-acetylglutamate synthase-like GNAT family acetyltransferase